MKNTYPILSKFFLQHGTALVILLKLVKLFLLEKFLERLKFEMTNFTLGLDDILLSKSWILSNKRL